MTFVSRHSVVSQGRHDEECDAYYWRTSTLIYNFVLEKRFYLLSCLCCPSRLYIVFSSIFISHASVIRTEICFWTTSQVIFFSMLVTIHVEGSRQFFRGWGSVSLKLGCFVTGPREEDVPPLSAHRRAARRTIYG